MLTATGRGRSLRRSTASITGRLRPHRACRRTTRTQSSLVVRFTSRSASVSRNRELSRSVAMVRGQSSWISTGKSDLGARLASDVRSPRLISPTRSSSLRSASLRTAGAALGSRATASISAHPILPTASNANPREQPGWRRMRAVTRRVPRTQRQPSSTDTSRTGQPGVRKALSSEVSDRRSPASMRAIRSSVVPDTGASSPKLYSSTASVTQRDPTRRNTRGRAPERSLGCGQYRHHSGDETGDQPTLRRGPHGAQGRN